MVSAALCPAAPSPRLLWTLSAPMLCPRSHPRALWAGGQVVQPCCMYVGAGAGGSPLLKWRYQPTHCQPPVSTACSSPSPALPQLPNVLVLRGGTLPQVPRGHHSAMLVGRARSRGRWVTAGNQSALCDQVIMDGTRAVFSLREASSR